MKVWANSPMSEAKLTGGRVNYYLAQVDYPQREDQPAYRAECEDIIEVLRMTPDEANIFKEIWRSASARLHNGKPGHTALYGAEKMVHYAGRILRRLRRKENANHNVQVFDSARESSSAGAAASALDNALNYITSGQEQALLPGEVA